ncbi:pseudouridine-5'-phosphatase-like [Acropora millepora]|uniref:pseudouridine-5'-phosphatase-like n=1 Tax=Acropora millepora TaxID=45264 RepID=UPI001CF0E620|nr:pseudouridine-5'-phosphatase-like [Acropora millepora]
MAEKGSMNCTHVIFDLDGLMLDTEIIYTRVTQELLDPYGKIFDWSVKSKMMGRSQIEAARVLVEELQLPFTAEEFGTMSTEKLWELFPTAALLPGVKKLVHHLHKHEIPFAVATGSSAGGYMRKIENHKDLFQLISHVVTSDDPELKLPKPAPDIFLLASQRFSMPPKSSEHVLVFEDAPNGVIAARAAGMNVVMVPDKRVDPSKFSQASLVLNSLEEFDPVPWGFPPFE